MEASDRISQEYQTALAINDWDYFLPRNHVNCPVKGKNYRIFQPQWKPIILFWLGRDDIDSEEKEAFIQKLVNFDDGCGEWSYKKADKGFYEYQAYFLAVVGINEFKECSLFDGIVEQIFKWVNDFSKIGNQKWITFLDLIKEGTRIVLSEKIKEKVITNLIQVLKTTEDEDIRRLAAYSLGEIAVGNELAIQELIQVLETTEDEDIRWNVAYILGEIAVENELAIQKLIQVLEITNDEDIRGRVVQILGEIAVGNELAIQELIRALETTKYEDTPWEFAYSLGKIAVGNELAIRELIRILETTKNEDIRRRVAQILGKIAVGNELVIQELIQVLETTKSRYTRWEVAYSLGEIAVENELAIRELIRVLETTKDKKIGWRIAYSLGKIDPGNELAIRELMRVLETTKDEYTRWKVADSLGEIDPGNELAIRGLMRVLETTKDEYTRWKVADSLRKIDPENELAIRELIRILVTTQDEDTCRYVADSLGKIDPENELAIRELIQVLETTKNEDTRWRVADSLGKIAVGNELAIRELIRILVTTQDEDTRWKVAYSLGKIIQTEKQYADVIFALKHNLTNEVYENNLDFFENCYKILWNIAKNLPYPKFYQAWHHNTFTPNSNNNSCHSERSEESQRSFASLRSAQDDCINNSEITDNTPVDNAPIVRQLEQQLTDIFTQLSHLPLHCINVNKLLTLNTESKFVQGFCNRLYQKVLPDQTIPKVQTITDLEREIIHLKQQLQTPQLFILLLADGTPTPEVLDCFDYLTEALHLGWVTPDPLPLPPPQRSFVVSQENLLKAVESWVAKY